MRLSCSERLWCSVGSSGRLTVASNNANLDSLRRSRDKGSLASTVEPDTTGQAIRPSPHLVQIAGLLTSVAWFWGKVIAYPYQLGRLPLNHFFTTLEARIGLEALNEGDEGSFRRH